MGTYLRKNVQIDTEVDVDFLSFFSKGIPGIFFYKKCFIFHTGGGAFSQVATLEVFGCTIMDDNVFSLMT
jgi:hypothetical protein